MLAACDRALPLGDVTAEATGAIGRGNG